MEVINGTPAADFLSGSSENEVIWGYQGNDYINGFGGRDTLHGGTGNDSLYSLEGDALMFGGQGNDTIVAYQGNDTLFGGAGNDIFGGSFGNDFLSGDAGDDELYGVDAFEDAPGAGEIDTLVGGNGRDYFCLGNKIDVGKGLPAQTYYTQMGNQDFGLIVDFDTRNDWIVLNRNDTYNLTEVSLPNFGSGLGIFVTTRNQNELIGFLPGFTSRQLVVSRDLIFE